MKTLISLLLTSFVSLPMMAQDLTFDKALFNVGDNVQWKNPTYDDSGWETLSVNKTWDDQGIAHDTRFGWYRIHIDMPEELLDASDLKEAVVFDLGMIDDCDEAYLNGKLIGKTGIFPGEPGDITNTFDIPRLYTVKASDINWNGDNLLAVRCFSGGAPGGMFAGPVKVIVPRLVDAAAVSFKQAATGGSSAVDVILSSKYGVPVSGILSVDATDFESGKNIFHEEAELEIDGETAKIITVPYDNSRRVVLNVRFREQNSGKEIAAEHIPHYILTPAAPDSPRFNTVAVYGVRPDSPVHFRFGVSGVKPIRFSSADLPEGLHIDPSNGALSGAISEKGDYSFTVVAENEFGKSCQEFTLKVGSRIALTPPMGWNSWNCWGLSVSQERVVSSAKSLIENGLADYGYNYINIDDGWEAAARNPDGTIGVNAKFPDMKGLGQWLHSEGLKFGIYSSPGDLTCGKFIGSLGHELQDAESYNEWGVDYLKYDWCGYSTKHETEVDNETTASYIRPYMLMQEYLRRQPRDIFYSLCQYGMADVWEWGHLVDANSWRTTYDISDRWETVYDIGFCQQADLHPYAKSGGWNDPDMLVVGKVGWSSNLRDSRLTVDEQYSHISLWSLLAANMMIGCDLAQIDDFTIGLLCNNEVNAVNQDVLGRQAKRDVLDGDLQVWSRPLSDGTIAVGIFNLGATDATVDFGKYTKDVGILGIASIRDIWRQADLAPNDTVYRIPSHGVKFIKVKGI